MRTLDIALACWLCTAAVTLQACAHHPDVIGHNAKARAWAEQERAREAEEKQRAAHGRGLLGGKPPDDTPPPPPPPPAH
jgi:hypothetical protein